MLTQNLRNLKNRVPNLTDEELIANLRLPWTSSEYDILFAEALVRLLRKK